MSVVPEERKRPDPMDATFLGDLGPIHSGILRRGARRDRDSRTSLRNLSLDDDTVDLRVTVERQGPRTIVMDGRRRVVLEGKLADDTGTADFLAWNEPPWQRGDTVVLRDASVVTWNDAMAIEIMPESTIAVIDRPLKSAPAPTPVELQNVSAGDRAIDVSGVVLEAEQDVVTSRGDEHRIRRGILGDRTARVPFTDWTARHGLKAGRSLKFSNVSVESFRGLPSITLGVYSSMHPVSMPSLPTIPRTHTIAELASTNGSLDILTEGTIVDLLDGSGLIRRCPSCARVLNANTCRSHGSVEPEIDLRTKAILDDGTGTLTIVLDAAITATIIDSSFDDVYREVRGSITQDVIAERISDAILGRPCRVRGTLRVTGDRPILTATTFMHRRTAGSDNAQICLREALT